MLKLNTTRLLFLMVLCCSLFLQNCKSDDESGPTPDPEPNPIDLEMITNLTLMDIGDNQNGTDLEVNFSKASDESNVEEYRVFVVKSSESSNFDLEVAESISEENYFKVNKTGNDLSLTLSDDSKNTSDELIGNDTPYKVYVMTVTSDPILYLNVLSNPSSEITLTTETIDDDLVKVTYIANDGVMIEYEDKKVIIDGMNRASNLSGWVSPSAAAYMNVENGVAPYDDIDLVMITHNHGDHYSTLAVQNYLTDHPNTKLIAPNSVEANFTAFSSQIPNYTVDKFERINLNENDISIDILHIEHFDQFGNDFSMVESYAYIITLNDKKFLHTGDIDYIDSQLDLFNILDDEIDVAFIPTFGNLVSAANRDALITNVNPGNIICLHFLTGTMSTTLLQVDNIYPGAETFTIPFQTLEY